MENCKIFFFSNKVAGNEKITSIEEGEAVLEDNEMADSFKSYFETIVENFSINSKYISGEPVNNESVTDIIRKFNNHSSMIKIKKNHQGHFSFAAVEVKDVYREIDSFDPPKAI